MTTRGEELAAQFAAVNDEVIATVAGCTDEQWRRRCAAEGWTVGVVAHHIAVIQQAFVGIVERLAAGELMERTSSQEEIDRNNARHAREYADVGKPETLDRLQTSGPAMVELLQRLDDAQLDGNAGVFGGQQMSLEQVVQRIVIGHAREHLASIRATIAD